jgi:hypothetical protein
MATDQIFQIISNADLTPDLILVKNDAVFYKCTGIGTK